MEANTKPALSAWLCSSFDADQNQIFFDTVLAESEDAAQKRVQAARPYATIVNTLDRGMAVDFMREMVDLINRDTVVDAVDYLLNTGAADPRDVENEPLFVKTDTGRWELKTQ